MNNHQELWLFLKICQLLTCASYSFGEGLTCWPVSSHNKCFNWEFSLSSFRLTRCTTEFVLKVQPESLKLAWFSRYDVCTHMHVPYARRFYCAFQYIAPAFCLLSLQSCHSRTVHISTQSHSYYPSTIFTSSHTQLHIPTCMYIYICTWWVYTPHPTVCQCFNSASCSLSCCISTVKSAPQIATVYP